MQRHQSFRRGAASTIIIALIAIVLIGGAVWYFTSDVFRTRVDEAYRQNTEWTPEQIAKDPVNYLNWAEGEVKAAQEKLKANEIAIAQNRGKLEGMKSDAENKIRLGETALAELKTSYTQAEQSNTWPVMFRGQPKTQDVAKLQIVSWFKEIESQRKLRDKVNGGMSQLDAQQTKVQQAKAEAGQQLAEIAANRELLKVQQITGDLQNKLVEMRGALQATVATASENTGAISLDQLVAESAASVDDAEFQKIMSGGKAAPPSGGGGAAPANGSDAKPQAAQPVAEQG